VFVCGVPIQISKGISNLEISDFCLIEFVSCYFIFSVDITSSNNRKNTNKHKMTKGPIITGNANKTRTNKNIKLYKNTSETTI
jgi:hypothetical protein